MGKTSEVAMKIEAETKDLKEILDKLVGTVKYELNKGIENVDAEEFGSVADAIKDIAKAKGEIVKSCYYVQIMEAMEEASDEKTSEEEGGEEGGEAKRFYRGQPRDSMGRFKSRRGSGRKGYEEPMYFTMTPEMYREHGPEYWRDMDREEGRMYYAGGGGSGSGGSGGSGSSGGGRGGSSGGMSGGMSGGSGGSSSGGGSSGGGGSRNYGGEGGRDYREGRSGQSRRSYIETKESRPGNSPEDKQAKTKELEKYMNELSSDISEMISGASNEEKTMLKTKLQTLVQKVQ